MFPWLWIVGTTIKTLDFYHNTYLINLSRLDKWLDQVTRKHILYDSLNDLLVRTLQISTVYFLGYKKLFVCSCLSLRLNDFLQLEIMQKSSSVQKVARSTAVASKKIKCGLCISSAVFCLNLQLKLNSLFSWFLFSAIIYI